MAFIKKTVNIVKIDTIDVVLTIVKWAIQCVISC